MRHIERVLVLVFSWVWYLPFLGVWTALLGLLTLLFLPFSRRAAEAVPVVWGRGLLWAGFTRVRVVGREFVQPGTQYVVMSNHRSHIDSTLVYGYLGLPLRWVMKLELRRVPILGVACARLGHIYIDRKDRAQAVQALRSGLAASRGASVVFFPEGTRTAGPELLPFKKGGFVLAADAGLPILPVSITGTERVLPPRTLRLHPFRRVTLAFHAPVPAPASPEAREALMETVRERIASGLEGASGAAERNPASQPDLRAEA